MDNRQKIQGIQPSGKQLEVVTLPTHGHFVILGTAGSGKTVIALLRAMHLANLNKHNKVLLVTFNRSLVEYMKEISGSYPSNLVVEHYHKFAKGYLNSRSKMPERNGILTPEQKTVFINKALSSVKKQNPGESTLNRRIEFFVDEITFIEKFGFESFDEYRKAERVGRASANIKRENRRWTFAVFEEYLKIRKKAAYAYDWDDIALYVYKEFINDTRERLYTHIIVDEGQDFSPMMIKSLVAATPKNGSFTFFGDVAQQIYGSRLSWRDSGLNIEKVWKFDANYRNPAPIVNFAKDITKSPYWYKDADMIEAANEIAEGPKPILMKFSNNSDEIEWVTQNAAKFAETSSVIIICRTRNDGRLFYNALRKLSCKVIIINKDIPFFSYENAVYISTFHSAKGLEFDNVFLPFLDDGKLPNQIAVDSAASEKEAYADEIKLLYVGATRSKYGLFMTYSNTLSPLFPVDSSAYILNELEENS